MLRRATMTGLAVALGASACEPPEPAEPTPQTAPEAILDPAMEQTAECRNPIEGYLVEYPADWHVNPEDVLRPCMLFDPDPIEVPHNSELPIDIAIMIGFEPVSFETLAGEILGRRVISREQTTIDGREGVRIEGETTGEGLHDAGIRMYEYVVDLGDTTMVVTTYEAGTLPFERRRRILDAMMATFDFVSPS